MKNIYVKPMAKVVGLDLDNVICAGSEFAKWGERDGKWPNEGQETGPNDTGTGVEVDYGNLDSQSKKHSWSVWDE